MISASCFSTGEDEFGRYCGRTGEGGTLRFLDEDKRGGYSHVIFELIARDKLSLSGRTEFIIISSSRQLELLRFSSHVVFKTQLSIVALKYVENTPMEKP